MVDFVLEFKNVHAFYPPSIWMEFEVNKKYIMILQTSRFTFVGNTSDPSWPSQGMYNSVSSICLYDI